MATGGLNLSSEFFQLLKAIGESKSKQEEDRIIAEESARIKAEEEREAMERAAAAERARAGRSAGSIRHWESRTPETTLRRILRGSKSL